jgi:hypothetical protein
MQRESLRSGWQRLLHLAGLAAGWALFVYWWYLVAINDWDETDVALIILVTLVVSPALTIGWVLHNRGIFRRKGPRMDQPRVAIDYVVDWNGRKVQADWAALADAAVVAVTVDGPHKIYQAEAPATPATIRSPAVRVVELTTDEPEPA